MSAADASRRVVLCAQNGVLTRIAIGEDDVANLLKTVGVAADKEAIKVMISKVAGKSIPALVAEGRQQFASMPAGGAPAASAAAPAEAKKVAAKVEVVEEEVDLDMGDMFGY